MKAHQICLQSALGALLLICTGCASIITSGDRTIPVTSNPSGATVTVFRMDKEVASGVTPAQIKLKKGAGYFKGADYRLVVQKDGYQSREFQIKHDINGWYFGNFGFGGILGLVVVDPLTGAMWVLKPDTIEAELQACAPATRTASLREKDSSSAPAPLSPAQQSPSTPLATPAPAGVQ